MTSRVAIVIAAASALAIVIYFARSAPSELAVCHELSDRYAAREQATRDSEPKDLAWAHSMEQKLREHASPPSTQKPL